MKGTFGNGSHDKIQGKDCHLVIEFCLNTIPYVGFV